MNPTIENTNAGDIRNSVKTRYIAAAAAAVLIFGAVAGVSGLEKSNKTHQVNPQLTVTSARGDIDSNVAPLRVYLAETPEEAAALAQDHSTDLSLSASAGLPLPGPATIVVKGSLVEQDLLSASGAVAGTGRPVTVVSGSSMVREAAVQPMSSTAAETSGYPSMVANPAASTSASSEYVYYLVSSEEQKNSLLASPSGDGFLKANVYILVVRSQQEELSIAGTQAELSELGHSAEVYDLRTP